MATTLNYATPGVYIQEIPVIPASIVSVPTAVPVFVGYTEKAVQGTRSLAGQPYQISSMLDYINYFGNAAPETGIVVTIDTSTNPPAATAILDTASQSKYLMYYSVQHYFNNGGATCYVLSIGLYNNNAVNSTEYLDKVSGDFCPILEQYNDITLVVCPDALGLPDATTYYAVQNQSLKHCIKMQNRMAVMDVYRTTGKIWQDDIKFLRDDKNTDAGAAPGSVFPGLSVANAPEDFKFGAVYFPRLKTTLKFNVTNYSKVKVNFKNPAAAATTMDKLKTANNQQYNLADSYIQNKLQMLMPAAPAMVGIYASIDNSFGVWKSPANVAVSDAVDVEEQVSFFDQEDLNIDPFSGMSVNAIRSFPGRGPAIVWGARTLAGNDNEWRYISVRRFFFMVEQSIKNAMEPFVFETNDVNTWSKVTAMISTYLTELWRAKALMGTTPKDAFVVQVGMGITMTAQDVLEGRMIVLVKLAVVRPAEFIVLQFEQLMPPQP